jgi:15-cis-phytoene synthase
MSQDALPETVTVDDWMAIVRVHDHDRYISALFAPADRRADLMLIYAFDAEMARIPRSVNEPMMGEIRLQWWRDALSPLLTDTGRALTSPTRIGHPLADAVVALTHRTRLPAGLIHGLIDARSIDLDDTPLRDDAELWSYIAKTDAAVLALAARVLEPALQPRLDDIAATAGRAIGLTRVGRRLSGGDRNAEMLVPLTIWPLDDRHTHAGDDAASIRFVAARTKAIQHLTELATAEMDRARQELSQLPQSLRPAFLPLALVPRYVTHIQRIVSNPALAGHDINPLTRLWTLWRARRKKSSI